MNENQDFKKLYFQRHLAAFGKITLEKLHKMSIIILNIRATGAELAKNICLSSPRRLTLVDDSIVTRRDMKFNYFASESDIGMHRSTSMCKKLSTLNSFVKVDTASFSMINEEFIKQYDIFMVTDFYDRHTLEDWNVFCRRNRVGFINLCCIGTFSNLFVDLGSLKIYDRVFHGKINQFYIEEITNEKVGVVRISKDYPHFFQDGDYISIHEVLGMIEVNGVDPRPIRVIDEFTFTIENTSRFGKFQGGGYVNFEKVPFTQKFTSFKKNVQEPTLQTLCSGDLTQLEYHASLLLYYDWHSELEENPSIMVDKTDGDLEQISMEIFMSNSDVNYLYEKKGVNFEKVQAFLISLIKFGDFQFTPVATCIANIAGFQQIVSSGKFTPVNQQLFFNFNGYNSQFGEFLEKGHVKNFATYFKNSPEDKHTHNYEDYRVGIFGCGSKGSEVLKLFYLMGIGKGEKGELVLIDDNKVSPSQLLTHFMCNNEDIGKFKSEVLKASILSKDPTRKIKAVTDHVVFGNKEDVKALMSGLDVIIATMDNYRFILKLIERAREFNIPLFILDTQDLRVTTHALIPTRFKLHFDQYEAMLRLKDQKKKKKVDNALEFPYLPSHCVKWAKNKFTDFFERLFHELKDFMHDASKYFKKLTDDITKDIEWKNYMMELIKEIFINQTLHNFADCVDIAIDLFLEFFNVRIVELIAKYPKDHITEGGKPFWNNIRRFPESIKINQFTDDDLNFKFVKSTSKLLCHFFMFTIPEQDIVTDIIRTKISNQENGVDAVTVQVTDSEFLQNMKFMEEKLKDFNSPPTINLKRINIKNSTNSDYYSDILDFIYSAGNIRSLNFNLKLTKKYKVEHAAFKITPNLDMISSMAASLMAIDLVKLSVDTPKELFKIPEFHPSLGRFSFEQSDKTIQKMLSKNSMDEDKSPKVTDSKLKTSAHHSNEDGVEEEEIIQEQT